VVFRERGGPSAAGALELWSSGLKLTGRAADRLLELRIELKEIADVQIGRRPADRLSGYPTVVLERAGMPAVQVAPVGAGLLHEIADLLSALAVNPIDDGDELTVIVPLKPGCLDRAKELLDHGPPLDPAALGLTGHEVYLRQDEVVFVFRGPTIGARVRRAMRSPALWRAGIAWQGCIAGRPRLVTATPVASSHEMPVYSWTTARNTAGQGSKLHPEQRRTIRDCPDSRS
jgi:hypothetical protein